MAIDPNLLLTSGRPVDPMTSYRVIRLLSRGGMGDILLAERHRFDGTSEQVVLKMLAPELQEEPYVSMFLSEARVMSELNHRNLVKLIDTPIVNGSRCLALELVKGTNLFQLIKRARADNDTVPVELAVYIGLETLAGLAYAHAAKVDGVPINLVHRDVKPGNVLLSWEGDVKLTDFGISKSELSTLRTTPGTLKGTPHYLSPEQVCGDPVTPRSDLFSLAAVMVEAISGVVLFKRDSLASTLFSVSSGERAAVEQLLPIRHRALARVLERALALDPMRRFESARAMASALAGAAPLDDEQAKKELGKRVRAICNQKGDPLGGPMTRRMHNTGAIPLEPDDFGEDDPTDEGQAALDKRSHKGTEPIHRESQPDTVPDSSNRLRNWTFILGVLVGALATCGLQAALRLMSISW